MPGMVVYLVYAAIRWSIYWRSGPAWSISYVVRQRITILAATARLGQGGILLRAFDCAAYSDVAQWSPPRGAPCRGSCLAKSRQGSPAIPGAMYRNDASLLRGIWGRVGGGSSGGGSTGGVARRVGEVLVCASGVPVGGCLLGAPRGVGSVAGGGLGAGGGGGVARGGGVSVVQGLGCVVGGGLSGAGRAGGHRRAGLPGGGAIRARGGAATTRGRGGSLVVAPWEGRSWVACH
jgi:hypothetical protein